MVSFILDPATRFGPYEIVGPLGAGGMGEVYRARDPRLQRDVALKILRQVNGHHPERSTRLFQEARAASALNHPNILVVHDLGTEAGVPFIVSELVAGAPLRTRLARPLPLKELLDLAVQIADGLATAHEAGLAHRDLKPENVMVTPDGRVKILDFGVAKFTPAGTRADDAGMPATATATELIQGTVPYMSPEQARGVDADFLSDQFSFGLLLYEMATGAPPFSRATPVQTLTAIIEDEPPPLLDANPRMPLVLQWIVDRCLAKNPRERYAATADLMRDLRMLRDRLAAAATAADVGATAQATRGGVRWWPWIAAMAAGATASGMAAIALDRPIVPPLPRHTPFVTDSGYQVAPAWSPDGKTVAYVADADGVLQVFTRSLTSSLRSQVTHARFDCRHPFWSPDSRRLYYLRQAGLKTGLFSVTAAGGPDEFVMANVESAALSADGRTLAFLRDDDQTSETLRLWTSSPPGAEPRRYARGALMEPVFDGTLRFTPDGSTLGVWFRERSSRTVSRLLLIPMDGRDPIEAPGLPGDLSSNNPPAFDWLPDNRRIVAALQRGPTQSLHLWLLDTRGGEAAPLTNGAGTERMPAVSPDGSRIAYASLSDNFDLIEAPLDGSAPRTLLETSRNEMEPSWSPVSDQYVFVTDRGGGTEIWLRNRAGDWERPLVTGSDFSDEQTHVFRMPAFAPDGQRIAFERVTAGGASIWIVPVSGGPPVPMTRPQPSSAFVTTYSPTWSPDGEWLAFAQVLSGHWSLAKVRVGDTSPPIVLHDITSSTHPQWSPDNRWIACNTAQGLTLVTPDGRTSRLLRDEPWLAYVWSANGSILYGIRLSMDLGRLELVAVDVASARERIINATLARVPPVTPPIKGFTRTLDKTVALSLIRARSDLWLLDDFFGRESLFARLTHGRWP